jgi:hypothetical protein
MIGRLHHVVVDCPGPAALAAFHSGLPGLPGLKPGTRPRRGEVAGPAGRPFCLIPRPAWAPPPDGTPEG